MGSSTQSCIYAFKGLQQALHLPESDLPVWAITKKLRGGREEKLISSLFLPLGWRGELDGKFFFLIKRLMLGMHCTCISDYMREWKECCLLLIKFHILYHWSAFYLPPLASNFCLCSAFLYERDADPLGRIIMRARAIPQKSTCIPRQNRCHALSRKYEVLLLWCGNNWRVKLKFKPTKKRSSRSFEDEGTGRGAVAKMNLFTFFFLFGIESNSFAFLEVLPVIQLRLQSASVICHQDIHFGLEYEKQNSYISYLKNLV